jgi:hypothetical protein
MLAYAIIAFELAILYMVFWYVFLREPQPYRIKGNPWGGYNRRVEQHKQSVEHANEQAIYSEWNLDMTPQGHELVRSRHKGVHKDVSTQVDENTSTFARQFLAKLGEQLNRINVKIP